MSNKKDEAEANNCITRDLGRDEMNLAEFPLAVIGRRRPGGSKTLFFSDTVWDKGANQHVERRLTVTSSDLLGLPTQFDEEVLLGCIQLSKQNAFEYQRLAFSRYELLKLLGKRTDGKMMKRVSESLDRWAGVMIISDKARWDKKHRCWCQGHDERDRPRQTDDQNGRRRDTGSGLGFAGATSCQRAFRLGI